jgi:hypothetical protein
VRCWADREVERRFRKTKVQKKRSDGVYARSENADATLTAPNPPLCRWRLFKLHVEHTVDGYVITEFLPKVFWSGEPGTPTTLPSPRPAVGGAP